MKDGIRCFVDTVCRWFVKVIFNHKGWIFAFAIVFLIGFITGIMTTVNYLDVVTHENIINKYLIELLTNKSTYLSFFLMLTLWYLIITILSIWFTKNTFFVVFNFIVLLIMAYIWGFDICIVVMTLGLAGVIYGVLILGLLGLFVFLSIIIIMSIACKKFFVTKNHCDNDLTTQYFKTFCIFIVLGIVLLFVMAILFSSIRIFVIVE